MGFKIYLSLHYSDTWADPGSQITPLEWQNVSFSTLKTIVAIKLKLNSQISENNNQEIDLLSNHKIKDSLDKGVGMSD